MLTPPSLAEPALIAHLRAAHGLAVAQIAFLPLGADINTAVYRALADDGAAHFVKLRAGPFVEASVAIPHWLSRRGLAQIIPPRPAPGDQLWTSFSGFTVTCYPFISGRDGFAAPLSERAWGQFGAAMAALHAAELPPDLAQAIPREQLSPVWRERVRGSLAEAESAAPTEPIAAAVVALLRERRATIADLLARADGLARALAADPPPSVLCHGDAHAGNLLIDDSDRLYLIDWDTLILAPKERDLMFIGGGQGFVGTTPAQEQALFDAGYGPAAIDRRAIAYYRYERIIQDIAAFCDELLAPADPARDADRAQSLRWLRANFLPGGTIDAAYQGDSR